MTDSRAASYRDCGRGLRRARRGQAPGDGQGAVDLPAAGRARCARARRLPRRARVRVRAGRTTLAFVVEGLGTKSIIARQVLEQQGINRFAEVAYDTVAAIVNDLCCVGALPLVVNAYFATGASEWYSRARALAALLEGWRRACTDAGCAWGGGESPSLPGLVDEREIELAGAAVGACPRGERRSRASGWGRAMRSCWWPPAGCTPTGPRWRGWSRAAAGGVCDGAAERGDAGRGAAGALGYVRRARAGTAAPGRVADIHEPRHGPRPAQADAPAEALTYRIRGCRRCPRCWDSWSRRRGWRRRPRIRRSTWGRATRCIAPRAPVRGGRGGVWIGTAGVGCGRRGGGTAGGHARAGGCRPLTEASWSFRPDARHRT